jgi:hypothetical protein
MFFNRKQTFQSLLMCMSTTHQKLKSIVNYLSVMSCLMCSSRRLSRDMQNVYIQCHVDIVLIRTHFKHPTNCSDHVFLCIATTLQQQAMIELTIHLQNIKQIHNVHEVSRAHALFSKRHHSLNCIYKI